MSISEFKWDQGKRVASFTTSLFKQVCLWVIELVCTEALCTAGRVFSLRLPAWWSDAVHLSPWLGPMHCSGFLLDSKVIFVPFLCVGFSRFLLHWCCVQSFVKYLAVERWRFYVKKNIYLQNRASGLMIFAYVLEIVILSDLIPVLCAKKFSFTPQNAPF